MRTTGRVQAGVRNQQPLHGFASNNVRFDDFIYVAGSHPAIPDVIGIDHHVRPVLALIEASGLIRSHTMFVSEHCQLLLERQLQLRLPRGIAATAWMSIGALVAADEDVSFKLRHKFNLQEKGGRMPSKVQ